jgi:hypothetical protein
VVLKAQTKKNGLSAPNQLTNEKLKIRMSTPIISMGLMYLITKKFILLKGIV